MAGTLTTATVKSSDSDTLYEVVDGEIVEVPPMGVFETWIASVLIQRLAGQKANGRAVVETLFDFTRTIGKKRRPDLAFVSYNRWPKEKQPPRTEAWDVVPNIAVEVVSPTNPADEVVDKIADYFRAGVERAWVIYPTQRQLYAYSGPTDVRVVTENDELVEDDILPGFRLRLGELFEN
jgi:Uma2 family endonuclease